MAPSAGTAFFGGPPNTVEEQSYWLDLYSLGPKLTLAFYFWQCCLIVVGVVARKDGLPYFVVFRDLSSKHQTFYIIFDST